jgi:hypothetical protein
MSCLAGSSPCEIQVTCEMDAYGCGVMGEDGELECTIGMHAGQSMSGSPAWLSRVNMRLTCGDGEGMGRLVDQGWKDESVHRNLPGMESVA